MATLRLRRRLLAVLAAGLLASPGAWVAANPRGPMPPGMPPALPPAMPPMQRPLPTPVPPTPTPQPSPAPRPEPSAPDSGPRAHPSSVSLPPAPGTRVQPDEAARPGARPVDGPGRGDGAPTPSLPPREGEARSPGGAPGGANAPGPFPGGNPGHPWPNGEARGLRAEQLLLRFPQWVEPDPVGAPTLRGELTVLLPEAPPSEVPDSAASTASDWPRALLAQGFTLLRERQVLGRRLVVVRTPPDQSLPRALDLLRRLLPGAEIDFNHVLLGTGRALAPVAEASGARGSGPTTPNAEAAALHIGLVDEAPRASPELRGTRIDGKVCESQGPASGHGTAVAAVLVRTVRGTGRPLVLHVADFGCGLGAVDTLASALQGFAAERVPVVNVSAAGPYNRVMAKVVELFLARGHVLVAAVGNEGPAAPPLYPAALPGVVAVTAVDERGRALVEASRGPHVGFAAPGIVSVEGLDGGSPKLWRGTSFAAPVVAGLLAARLPTPDREAAQAAIASLALQAVDAGAPGRDPVYGHGLLGVGGNAQATASN